MFDVTLLFLIKNLDHGWELCAQKDPGFFFFSYIELRGGGGGEGGNVFFFFVLFLFWERGERGSGASFIGFLCFQSVTIWGREKQGMCVCVCVGGGGIQVPRHNYIEE